MSTVETKESELVKIKELFNQGYITYDRYCRLCDELEKKYEDSVIKSSKPINRQKYWVLTGIISGSFLLLLLVLFFWPKNTEDESREFAQEEWECDSIAKMEYINKLHDFEAEILASNFKFQEEFEIRIRRIEDLHSNYELSNEIKKKYQIVNSKREILEEDYPNEKKRGRDFWNNVDTYYLEFSNFSLDDTLAAINARLDLYKTEKIPFYNKRHYKMIEASHTESLNLFFSNYMSGIFNPYEWFESYVDNYNNVTDIEPEEILENISSLNANCDYNFEFLKGSLNFYNFKSNQIFWTCKVKQFKQEVGSSMQETSIVTFVIGLGGYKKSDWEWMQHNGRPDKKNRPKHSPAFDQKIKTLYQTNKSNIKTESISNGC
jgi:hypothetical protein